MCPLLIMCVKQFRVSVNLNHVTDVHEGIKKCPYDICRCELENGPAQNDHRRIQTGELSLICHFCGKAFKTKPSSSSYITYITSFT